MNRTGALSRKGLVETLAKYIGRGEAEKELDRVCKHLELTNGTEISSEELMDIVRAVEDSLGKEVGDAMARAVITDRLEIKQDDVGRFYESFYRMRRQLLDRQRKAEKLNEELTRLKELYENVSRSIPIGLCSVDMDLNVTTWNRAMEAITGVPAGHAVGVRAAALVPRYEPLMRKALQLRKVVREQQAEHAGADGERRFASVTVSPLVDRYDVLHGLAISVQDITDRVEFEESMLRAEKLASVGRLAAGVAHEVGNPLTSISSLVQEMAEGGGGDEAFMNESLDLIGHHIQRISGVLNSLVDYSRRRESSFVSCCVADIIGKAASLLTLDRRGHGIELRVEDGGVPPVHCDPDQIQQVFINLFFNAADAMEGKGTITVTLRRALGAVVAVSVSDEGPGMTGDILRHAGSPFFTTKPVGRGTGLGLYVCYNILESHNSRMNISSAPGKGTTIGFELAAAQER